MILSSKRLTTRCEGSSETERPSAQRDVVDRSGCRDRTARCETAMSCMTHRRDGAASWQVEADIIAVGYPVMDGGRGQLISPSHVDSSSSRASRQDSRRKAINCLGPVIRTCDIHIREGSSSSSSYAAGTRDGRGARGAFGLDCM